jgi:hypothetical protein
VIGAAEPLAQSQGFLDQRPGLGVEAELGVDAAQGVEEAGAQQRLVAELSP